jgi:hypothetical protein
MQMCGAYETVPHAADEELTSPDRPIVAIACAIERHTDHACRQLVTLGEDARDVSPVVLNGDRCATTQCERKRGRRILRVQVVRDDRIRDIYLEDRQDIGDGLAEGEARVVVLQVADVLADTGLSVHHQRDRVLQVGTDRQDGSRGRQLRDNARGISSRTTQKDWLAGCANAHHRIVHAPGDGTLARRNMSAIPVRRVIAFSSRYAIGSFDWLPLVMTRRSGAPASNNR